MAPAEHVQHGRVLRSFRPNRQGMDVGELPTWPEEEHCNQGLPCWIYLQCDNCRHWKETHFQSEETFHEWCEAFKKAAVARKQDPSERICLLLDFATQHGEAARFLADAGVDIVKIPPKQTHVFQPADQYVIACLKSAAKKAWNTWVADQFASKDVEEAVADVNTTSVPLARKRKVIFICEAAEKLSVAPVLKSWERTGIPRALWGTQSDEVLYDLYVEAVGLGVENLNDKPDEIDPAEPAEPVRAKRGRPPLTADEKAEKDRSKEEERKKKAVGHTGPTLLDLWKKKQ